MEGTVNIRQEPRTVDQPCLVWNANTFDAEGFCDGESREFLARDSFAFRPLPAGVIIVVVCVYGYRPMPR